MADERKVFNILVVREYTDSNGEVKKRYHEAGTAWLTKDGKGFTGEIVEGLALTGRFAVLPREKKKAEDGGDEE